MLYGMKTLRKIMLVECGPGDSAGSPGVEFRSSGSKNAPILFAVYSGIVGKSQRSGVGIAGVVQVDAIVPKDMFHRFFEGDGLRVEVTRGMGAAGQGADRLRSCIFRV